MELRVSQIPEAVQRRWLADLLTRWTSVNATDCGRKLRPPSFALIDTVGILGRWDGKGRVLSINVRHLATDTWAEVEETLRHEMAHQLVQEVLGGVDSPAHGELFARACAQLRIQPSTSGPAATPEQTRVVARIRKLLTLSESDNEHEAQTAMAHANKLLLRHNIDRVGVEAPDAAYGSRRVGEPVGRISAERKLLSNILQSHFFVKCIWIRTRRAVDDREVSFLEIVGQHDSLELASYAHDYLERLLDELWERYRRQPQRGRVVRGSDRGGYRVGLLMGFKEHLDAQSRRHEQEGLVWLGDPGADALYERRHPRTSRLSAGSYRGGSAHDQGRADGRNIRIRPGLQGGSPVSRGRLLPG